MSQANDTAIYLRIPTDLKVKLHDLANQRGGRKFSRLVREALEEKVEKELGKVSA